MTRRLANSSGCLKNGDMYISAEMLTTLLTGLGLLLSLVAAVGWITHRMYSIAERLDARITSACAELKEDFAVLRTEIKGDIAELRTELKADIAELRTEIKGDIARVRDGLTAN